MWVRVPISWMLLAALVVGGIAGGDGLTLCLGMDGHVGVKGMRNSVCHEGEAVLDSADAALDSPSCTHPAGEACGPCVDIPLAGGQRARSARRLARRLCRRQSHAALALAAASWLPKPQRSGQDARIPQSVWALAPLEPTSTIVLLI
jgi:hypothetical protein